MTTLKTPTQSIPALAIARYVTALIFLGGVAYTAIHIDLPARPSYWQAALVLLAAAAVAAIAAALAAPLLTRKENNR